MMTEQQFDARLQTIEEQTAAHQEKVDGYRDQHLAAGLIDVSVDGKISFFGELCAALQHLRRAALRRKRPAPPS